MLLCVDGRLQPAAVRRLREEGVVVALWFPDCVDNLGRQLMLAAPYSRIFSKDPVLVQRLQALTDVPTSYLPEACNPAWHQPRSRVDVDPVVLVAGNLYPSRLQLLDRLYRAGIPLELRGSGFPRWVRGFEVQRLPVLPPVFRHEKAAAFRRAAAVLNNLHPAETGVNCRLFEAAGCGAVVLCEDRPVLGELFERGQEVMTFSSFDELRRPGEVGLRSSG